MKNEEFLNDGLFSKVEISGFMRITGDDLPIIKESGPVTPGKPFGMGEDGPRLEILNPHESEKPDSKREYFVGELEELRTEILESNKKILEKFDEIINRKIEISDIPSQLFKRRCKMTIIKYVTMDSPIRRHIGC